MRKHVDNPNQKPALDLFEAYVLLKPMFCASSELFPLNSGNLSTSPARCEAAAQRRRGETEEHPL